MGIDPICLFLSLKIILICRLVFFSFLLFFNFLFLQFFFFLFFFWLTTHYQSQERVRQLKMSYIVQSIPYKNNLLMVTCSPVCLSLNYFNFYDKAQQNPSTFFCKVICDYTLQFGFSVLFPLQLHKICYSIFYPFILLRF
jgi:hypothetical protein